MYQLKYLFCHQFWCPGRQHFPFPTPQLRFWLHETVIIDMGEKYLSHFEEGGTKVLHAKQHLDKNNGKGAH
jgi:hypothetical protein